MNERSFSAYTNTGNDHCTSKQLLAAIKELNVTKKHDDCILAQSDSISYQDVVIYAAHLRMILQTDGFIMAYSTSESEPVYISQDKHEAVIIKMKMEL